MAGSPDYKVYDSDRKYQAACKELEAAGALVALYGHGATIRWGHKLIIWVEGAEKQPAGNSYDFVAEVYYERIDKIRNNR